MTDEESYQKGRCQNPDLNPKIQDFAILLRLKSKVESQNRQNPSKIVSKSHKIVKFT